MVGLEEILKSNKKGILFLPNHPAEIDPVIIIASKLGCHFRPRPLVTEQFFFKKGIRIVMDIVRGLQIPEMTSANKWKEQQIEKTKIKITEALNRGDNFLIYPAGRLKRTNEERIGAAFLVYDLLRKNPDCNVVLIRTTGLWGSSFSRQPTKASPDFGKVFLRGIKTILKNGIFFTPRRSIKIELQWAPDDFPRRAEKMEFNRWLENWYNRYGPEPVKPISYLFWKHEIPEQVGIEEEQVVKEDLISEEKPADVLTYLSRITQRPIADLHPHLQLSNDLGLDSLDIGQLIVFLEDRYDIGHLALGQLKTVNDAFLAALGKKEPMFHEESEKKSIWPQEDLRASLEIPHGATVQEVFLKSCDRLKGAIACVDPLTEPISYQKMKQGALVLSLKIREMPGEKIGILLPSSVAAYLTILATLLAGKIPVMLNWTAGFRNLEYAAELCNLKTILSSYRFLSHADNVDLGKTDEQLILLEDVRHSISLITKLKGLFLSFQPASKIAGKTKEDDIAVILFTSGTETLPKGVPLTHCNVLSNHRALINSLPFNSNDISYGVLPPFHSMGFSVTGLFPILAGLKACYAPNPTNSRSLVKDIAHWKPTLFPCAPGFVKSVFQIAKEEQLKSLRMVMTGADKAPSDLKRALQGQGKIFVEGYGVSECSPIVTIVQPGRSDKGVGQPIPHVEICIINPEDGQLVEQGQDGEICISGPGVFNGYLGIKSDPFITLGEKRWYRSGDRGHLEPDGTLVLTGRLKRFIKIGGEMVSLGGIEADLHIISREKGWIAPNADQPQLAVGVKDRGSEKPQIILYVIGDVNREEANKALRELGHGSIVKIAEVKKVSEIPLTGTGKVQYRLLDEMTRPLA